MHQTRAMTNGLIKRWILSIYSISSVIKVYVKKNSSTLQIIPKCISHQRWFFLFQKLSSEKTYQRRARALSPIYLPVGLFAPRLSVVGVVQWTTRGTK